MPALPRRQREPCRRNKCQPSPEIGPETQRPPRSQPGRAVVVSVKTGGRKNGRATVYPSGSPSWGRWVEAWPKRNGRQVHVNRQGQGTPIQLEKDPGTTQGVRTCLAKNTRTGPLRALWPEGSKGGATDKKRTGIFSKA